MSDSPVRCKYCGVVSSNPIKRVKCDYCGNEPCLGGAEYQHEGTKCLKCRKGIMCKEGSMGFDIKTKDSK